MSKRELYDGVIAEVEYDKALIKVDSTTTYAEVVESEGMRITLPEKGVSLKSATSVFADYDVRDALLIKTMEDEEFAFVLINKIGTTVSERIENKTITQDDVEALATAGQILTMWEQFPSALVMTALLDSTIESHNLVEPSLSKITKKLLEVSHSFPFAQTRKQTVSEIGNKVAESLSNE